MDGLLKALLERPGDRATLRVYADALLAQSDALGEYLTLTAEQENAAPYEEKWEQLGERLRALERAHRRQWVQRSWGDSVSRFELPGTFRGLPSSVMVRLPAAVPQTGPVAVLRLHSQAPKDLEALAANPVLRGVCRLEPGYATDYAGHGALLASPLLSSLEELSVPWAGGRCVDWLAALPRLGSLEVLEVYAERVAADPAQFAKLLALPMPALKRLHVRSLSLDAKCVAALTAAPLRPAHLMLEYTALGPAGAKALFQSALMGELVTLDLNGSEIGAKGLAALMEAKAPKLASLDLSSQGNVGPALAGFFEGVELPALRRLVLASNAVRAAGAKALAGSKRLSRITRLGLAHCHLKDDGAAELAKAKNLAALRSLELAGNSMTKAGIAALAKAPFLPQLERLGLSHNKFQTEGGKALAAAKDLSKLKQLSLGHNWLGALGMRALLANKTLTSLEQVEEGLNNYGPELVRGFVKNAHLPLKVLSCGHEAVDEELVELVRSPRAATLDELGLPFTLTDALVAALEKSEALKAAKTVLVAAKTVPEPHLGRLRAVYGQRLMLL